MIGIGQIRIGNNYYEITDFWSDINEVIYTVPSPSSVILYNWLGKVFLLNFYYKTTFYEGSDGKKKARIGGPDNADWTLLNGAVNTNNYTYVAFHKGYTQYGTAIIENNNELCIASIDDDGHVYFQQCNGATFSNSTSVGFYGQIHWMIGSNA